MKSSTWLDIFAVATLITAAVISFIAPGSGFAVIAFAVFKTGASICRTIEKQSK